MKKLVVATLFVILFSLSLITAFNFPSDSTTFITFTGNLTNWRNLSDTPSSFSGQSLRFVRVNSGETSLEFTPLASMETDPIWSANYSTYLTLFNWNKTYADTLYYGINNPSGFYNSTTIPLFNSTSWNKSGI